MSTPTDDGGAGERAEHPVSPWPDPSTYPAYPSHAPGQAFSGPPMPGEMGHGPRPPAPRRRGLAYVLIMLAGLAGAAVLAWSVGSFALQEIRQALDDGSTGTTHVQMRDQEELTEDLAAEGSRIEVDWESGPLLNEAGLDGGRRVESAPGVLLVDSMLMDGIGVGTGMVLSEDGLALTNYHVVEDSSEVRVTIADTGETFTAIVLGRDAEHDVAVLQLEDAQGLETVSIDTDEVRRGEVVAAVGNGGGQGYLTAVTGEITGRNRSIMATSTQGDDASLLTGLLETDADVVPGYSGGPMVGEDGRVFGVSTAASNGTTTQEVDGYAIPISVALGVVEQVLSGEETDTVSIGVDGALGIVVTTVDEEAVIVEVTEGSAADRLGLQAEDVVLSVDGESVSGSQELADSISSRNVGERVNVEWRDTAGQTHTGTATLQEAVVN